MTYRILDYNDNAGEGTYYGYAKQNMKTKWLTKTWLISYEKTKKAPGQGRKMTSDIINEGVLEKLTTENVKKKPVKKKPVKKK